jgi:hypothetical protein
MTWNKSADHNYSDTNSPGASLGLSIDGVWDFSLTVNVGVGVGIGGLNAGYTFGFPFVGNSTLAD